MTNEPAADTYDWSLTAVFAERRGLLNLAFRMLGSSYDAEDVVQETYLRWYALSEEDRRAIEVPIAWVTRVAGRICLDQLSSARVRRESYVGEWLPEPLPGTPWDGVRPAGSGTDPADQVSLDETVTMGVLVVLDSVTPAERVAFILHDIFGVPFSEIAQTVGRSPAACRQLASSARRRLRAAQPHNVRSSRHREVVAAFKRACETGDLAGLVGLLDANATATSDGGGKVRAALRPLVGAERIARFCQGALRREPAISLTEEQVSGRPGLVGRLGGTTVVVIAIDFNHENRIDRLWAMLHPDKLHAWRNRDVAHGQTNHRPHPGN